MAPLVLAAVAALANAQLGGAALPPEEARPQLPERPGTPEERWRVLTAFGYHAVLLDSEDAVAAGGGYDLRVEAGRISAAATADVALWGNGAQVLVLAGAGLSRPVARGLAGHARVVGGMHWVRVEERDGPGWQTHLLPAVGICAGMHRFWGVGRILAFGAVEATFLRDLRTPPDAFLGRVGGWSAILSVSADLGFGFGRRATQPWR